MSKPDPKKKPIKPAPAEPAKPQNVRVGILCKPGTQSITYQTFLQKKDFDVKLYHKLDLGIKGALIDQIRFLFVDLDIPDSKVSQFVIAVGKVLPLYIIPFTNASHGKLRKIQPHLKTPYCIFPPTTPSAIHRMIVRIQLEEERAKTVGEGDVFVKSSVLAPSGNDLITVEDRKKMEEKLMMVFKSEKPIGDDLEGVEEAQELKLDGSQSQDSILKDGEIHDENEKSSTEMLATDSSFAVPEGELNGTLNSPRDEAEKSDSNGAAEPFGKKNLEFGKPSDSPAKQNLEFGDSTDGSSKSGLDFNSKDSNTSGNLFGKQELLNGIQMTATSKAPFKSTLTDAEKTLITRATLEALQKTFGSPKTSENGNIAITQVSEIHCFSVNTQRFKGYMLYAHSGAGKGHRVLLNLIRQKLAIFLKENGEIMNENEALMDLRVIEVDLEPWAFEKAEFLIKCADAEEEVAMAFIPREDVDTPLEESAKKEMLKLKIKELKANTRLEFDAFIFMPVNDKYVRYHKQGNVFEQTQKDRLEQKGINDLHIKKEAISDIQKYRAVVFLDEKIAEYKKQSQPGAA